MADCPSEQCSKLSTGTHRRQMRVWEATSTKYHESDLEPELRSNLQLVLKEFICTRVLSCFQFYQLKDQGVAS